MIQLLVRDMDKSKSFYTDKLGFKVVKEVAYGDNRWVTVAPFGGGTVIALGTAYEDLKPGFILKMHLSTADVEGAYENLKAKGVQPNNEIRTDSWGKWFSVYDPDGNYLYIVQS